MAKVLEQEIVPAVGQVWLCDVTGRVPWSLGNVAADRAFAKVRLTWVSTCTRVFEGVAINPKKHLMDANVHLHRSLLREKVS